MSEITASLVKELREKTGVGMMDCKTALLENNGDIESSIDWLRTKGIAKAAKKEGRLASEGLIAIEKDESLAAIIEVNSETDFVAMNDENYDEERESLTVEDDVDLEEDELDFSKLKNEKLMIKKLQTHK